MVAGFESGVCVSTSMVSLDGPRLIGQRNNSDAHVRLRPGRKIDHIQTMTDDLFISVIHH
jgi:hypothetical protein